jgi:two-component sensor histidine kinase
LLNLQASNIKDAETLAIFKECRDRVRSMALIHEYLYKSEDLAHLDVKEYVSGLVKGLYNSYFSTSGKVACELDIKDVPQVWTFIKTINVCR